MTITLSSTMDERRAALVELLERSSPALADEGHCGEDGLPCGVCNSCIEDGFWDMED